MSSKEETNETSPKQSQIPPRSGTLVGSISGSRTASGTITGLEGKGSFDSGSARPSTPVAPSSTRRSRLYSEEDEEIRRAKAMALAIAQNPGVSDPEEIKAIVEQQKQQQKRVSVKSTVKTFQESLRTSQKKAKERFQGMVGGASSSSAHSSSSRSGGVEGDHSSNKANKSPNSPLSSDAPVTRSKVGSPLRGLLGNSSRTISPPSLSPPELDDAPDTQTKRTRTLTDDVDVPKSSWTRKLTSEYATAAKAFTSTETVRLTSIVWKRRSGLGKLSVTKAWERRRIILQGSKLIYFYHKDEEKEDGEGGEPEVGEKKSTWLGQAAVNLGMASIEDPSTPRGILDLVKERATVGAASGHSGAPTPFALSIKVKGDTYWKLCFDSHSELMEWLAALTDVVVTSSVDEYNHLLLAAFDPSTQEGHHSLVLPPPPQKPTDEHEGGHRLWMLGKYSVRSSRLLVEDDLEELEDSDEKIAGDRSTTTASISTAASVPVHTVKDLSADSWSLSNKDVYAMVVIVNVALVYSHASSTSAEGFWYVVTFANLGLWYCLTKDEEKRRKKPALKVPVEVEETLPEPEVGPGPKSAKKARRRARSARGMSKSGAVAARTKVEEKPSTFKPNAGTTTVKIENVTDPPVNDKNEVFGGWRSPSGEVLQVRSHGYLTTKKKIPSPGELYECSRVEIFESPNRYPDMAPRVKLPEVKFEDDGPKTWRAPDIFVVSVALPTDPPKLRGSSSDGGGYTITIYFTMKPETRQILRRVTAGDYDPSKEEEEPKDVQKSKVNAVKLFEEWCRRAPTDPAFQSRFKLVAESQNLKEIGMPNWIAKYNGKPVLIKRAGQTGFIFTHPELSAIEFDISFHPFPYLAKQAICYMKEHFFKKVLVTFGFVIEGRSDDELPECVIGLMQLCYPDPIHAIQAQDFFDGTSIKSF